MSHWILSKTFRFEASHQLPHHDGLCARLHGHSWVGKVYIYGDALKIEPPECGMVTDFLRIKQPIQKLIEKYLDHRHLNGSLRLLDDPSKFIENPTSEEIARWIYKKLKPEIPGLVAVSIEETCTSACYYTEEDIKDPWQKIL